MGTHVVWSDPIHNTNFKELNASITDINKANGVRSIMDFFFDLGAVTVRGRNHMKLGATRTNIQAREANKKL